MSNTDAYSEQPGDVDIRFADIIKHFGVAMFPAPIEHRGPFYHDDVVFAPRRASSPERTSVQKPIMSRVIDLFTINPR